MSRRIEIIKERLEWHAGTIGTAAYDAKPHYANDVAWLLSRLNQAADVVRSLSDLAECRYDHHGHCQEHGWTESGECPNAAAKNFLRRVGMHE